MNALQQIYQSTYQTQKSAQTTENNKSASTTDALKSGGMGKDQFLELLVTQLKNQNPLKPMDNKEFISQMAQFSSLEQMNNLNSTMGDFLRYQKLSQVSSLVGKKVNVLDSNTGQTITGKIDKVSLDGENSEITVNGQQYPASNIQEVLTEG